MSNDAAPPILPSIFGKILTRRAVGTASSSPDCQSYMTALREAARWFFGIAGSWYPPEIIVVTPGLVTWTNSN